MTDSKMVVLADLDDPRLESLARLHQSVMRSLLTDLGPSIILRWYRLARADECVIGYCLMAANGDVAGWVVGSADPATLNARLRKPMRWFAGQLLRLAMTRPAVLWQLALSASSSTSQKVAEGVVELTYLGVAAEARGKGLGNSLLAAFMSASRVAGYKFVELSVEKDNSAALGLYTKFGFVQKRISREGRFDRHRMEFEL